MPQYAYEAIGKSKKVYRGVAEADRPEDVVTILRETGLYAYSVRVKKPVYLFPLQTSRKVRISDLSRLTRQFATLISSGVTVPQSLAILANQSTNAVLAKALKKITADVTAGASLADAFGKFPEIFDDLFVSMLRAGELGGNLTDILSRLSVHLEKEMKLRSNIKSAVNYPRFVGSFALVMFIVMMVFLVPSFKDFTSSATEIPAVTQFIYDLSDSMRGFWYVWLLVLSAMALAVVMFFRSRIGHELWERRKLRMPLVGSLISKTVISRFVRTLATLLRGGIPIVRALEISGPTSGSLLVANAVEAAAREIEIGRTISAPLLTSGVFPPMVTEMIAVGEESGNLPDMLDKISEFFDDEIDAESKNLGTTMEPILLILVGVLVGGMLIALYLPMFTSVLAYS